MSLSPYYDPAVGGDESFVVEAPKIKFGVGGIGEVGEDAKALGMTRVALFTDQWVGALEHVARARASLKSAGLDVVIYDATEVEPTDRSFKAASQFALEGKFDGYVSVGGGSVIDTAKAANLFATHPAEFIAYVNAPVGEARPVPGPLMPHIACPTTFGTASECTGIAVFDFLELEAKTGIANPRLRPSLGIIDPSGLATLPTQVIAANAFDVFSHAVESYTARPFSHRAKPETPDKRPLLQGANPYSDLASMEAIRVLHSNIVPGVQGDPAAHEKLAFSGLLAGIGFGNAGCHVPHGMAYAVAGLVRDYVPEGWHSTEPMVPHGTSVIVNAPAVFRVTGKANPERHMQAAEAMGADTRNVPEERAGDVLADRIEYLMKECGMPNGLSGVGYNDDDIDALTEGAIVQKRLLDLSPVAIDKPLLKDLFRSAMRYW